MPDTQDTPPDRAPSLVSMAIRDGEVRVRALGLPRRYSLDVYHRLMAMSWTRLGLLSVGFFVAFNLGFAGLYRLNQAGLGSAPDAIRIPLFWEDFFFSIHTVATIGYGNVYPVSLPANIIVFVEITLGLIYFALATGLAFARFSRPTARFLFSRTALIREVGGVPTFMLRAANQRHNFVYSAQARLSLLIDDEVGGVRMRRFVDLPLLRASNPVFTLTWTIMHAITEDSPMRRWLEEPSLAADEEIIVILSGNDEISGQLIHGRWAYCRGDVRTSARFADIVSTTADGTRTIDYRRFHATIEDDAAITEWGE